MQVCTEPGNDMDKPGPEPAQGCTSAGVEPDKEKRSLTPIAQRLIKTSEAFFLGMEMPGEGEQAWRRTRDEVCNGD